MGLIDSLGLFLDTGGDGRIAALIAREFRIPTITIESDDEIADRAESNIKYLEPSSPINGASILNTRGDFLVDDTYSSVGVRFEDISTIFNYESNKDKLAEKISRQSPSGTKFLLYGIKPPYLEFEGLTFEHHLELVDPSVLVKDIDWTNPRNPKWVDVPYTSFIDCYVK